MSVSTDQHTQIARVIATHCCCCRKELTDAESVEWGIGPICSRRYYNPLHVPSQEDLEIALGMLASSGLPEFVLDDFLKFSDKGDARKASNVLVYYASCHYEDRDEVFQCSCIIRALGYTQLADKLELDRTSASVIITDTGLDVFIPDKYRLTQDIKGIPGCTELFDPNCMEQAKRGHKVGWTFPKEQEAYLMAVLGVYLGGELMCGTRGIRTIPYRRWTDMHAFRIPAPRMVAAPPVQLDLPGSSSGWLVTSGPFLEVRTPYKEAFKDELKALFTYREREWTGSYWRVAATKRSQVEALILKHFGAKP
jgi:hypothetical protein